MGDDKTAAYNVFAWLFNVSTSICIVFVNKILMGSNGYMFNFGASQAHWLVMRIDGHTMRSA